MSFFDSSYFVVIDRRICTRDEQPTGAAVQRLTLFQEMSNTMKNPAAARQVQKYYKRRGENRGCGKKVWVLVLYYILLYLINNV